MTPSLHSGSDVYLGGQASGPCRPWDYSDQPITSSPGNRGAPALLLCPQTPPLGPAHMGSSSLYVSLCDKLLSIFSRVMFSAVPTALRQKPTLPSKQGAEEAIRAACWESDPSSEARSAEMHGEGALCPLQSSPWPSPVLFTPSVLRFQVNVRPCLTTGTLQGGVVHAAVALRLSLCSVTVRGWNAQPSHSHEP